MQERCKKIRENIRRIIKIIKSREPGKGTWGRHGCISPHNHQGCPGPEAIPNIPEYIQHKNKKNKNKIKKAPAYDESLHFCTTNDVRRQRTLTRQKALRVTPASHSLFQPLGRR
ncbi:hypothetical protein VN97_g5692 [Penicillium thymicola]|uniref:Uncharacterized protein n=1 Tax=Penicillium thymicola TaxID=293382 RepID=A0AAI9X8F4_PENTH|nr:hypothetical protein VN97_g5692 [Penicillium thymicola]